MVAPVYAAQLPDWLNSENIRTIAVVVFTLAVVGAILIARFVQKVTMKIAGIVLMLAIGLIFWNERAHLGECAKTGSCKMLGFDVKVPDVKAPAINVPGTSK
ncbi:MAG: hypothetical protein AB7L13_23195 [Acidimicrobiia bacterium]